MAQIVKNLPEMGETWVQSLGWEDPVEEEMATHSSILFFCLFVLINLFNWRLITLQYCFLPYIDMNQPWVYMCSPS